MDGDKKNELIKVKPEEIVKNNGKQGKPLWILIHDKVYDITHFNHPGGRDVFKFENEDDMDKGDEFDSIHAPASKKQADKYLIGELVVSEEKREIKKKEKIAANTSSNGMFVVFVMFLVIVIVIVKGGYLSNKQPETPTE